jgi:hypothetical protein
MVESKSAFGGHRLQFRENESERKKSRARVHRICTRPPPNYLISPNSLSDSCCPEWGRRNWEVSGTSPFIRFGIQLYHAFLTTILLRHGQLHHVGDDHVFRWPLYQRRVRLSPVPESQVEDKGDETSHSVVARKR